MSIMKGGTIKEKMREHKLCAKMFLEAIVKWYTMLICYFILKEDGFSRPKGIGMKTIRKDIELLELALI